MTIDERLARIEHVTAGLDEQWRREENRTLWRDTQRQIDALGRKIADTNDLVARLAEESHAGDRRLAEKIERLAEDSRAEDQRLKERIDELVSAMGRYIAEKK